MRRDAQGGRDAAPINARVLKWYYARTPVPAPWPEPEGIVERSVDRRSGQLAGPWCPADLVYREVYMAGTEPRETCSLHGPWGARESEEEKADSLAAPVTEDFEF